MSRNIRLLYLHNLLTDFRFQAPFAVIYFQQITSSYTAATFVLSLEVISCALLDIPTGIFSDKIGRKYTLAIGSASCAASLAFYAFAQNLATLICGACLLGLSLALFSGNNNALLFETLKAEGKEKQYHHVQGRASSMFQLGLGISALLASFIAPHGLRIVFMLGIAPQVLATIVSLFFVEPRKHIAIEEKSFAHLRVAFGQVVRNPRLRLLTVAQSMSYGIGEAVYTFNNAFINSLWPIWAVAIYRALTNGLGFIGFWFAGKLIDRIKVGAVLVLASTYGLVSGLIATLMANVISPIVFLSGSLFFGPSMVAYDYILQQEFTDKQRATMASVISFSSRFVSGLAALALGAIADHFGLVVAMVCGVIGSGIALPVYLRLFRKHL